MFDHFHPNWQRSQINECLDVYVQTDQFEMRIDTLKRFAMEKLGIKPAELSEPSEEYSE